MKAKSTEHLVNDLEVMGQKILQSQEKSRAGKKGYFAFVLLE